MVIFVYRVQMNGYPGSKSTEWKEGITGLYVRTNHKGVLWTGRFGGSGNFVSNTYSLHCHHQNDSALRWAVV